jgi:hypothetical protein
LVRRFVRRREKKRNRRRWSSRIRERETERRRFGDSNKEVLAFDLHVKVRSLLNTSMPMLAFAICPLPEDWP